MKANSCKPSVPAKLCITHPSPPRASAEAEQAAQPADGGLEVGRTPPCSISDPKLPHLASFPLAAYLLTARGTPWLKGTASRHRAQRHGSDPLPLSLPPLKRKEAEIFIGMIKCMAPVKFPLFSFFNSFNQVPVVHRPWELGTSSTEHADRRLGWFWGRVLGSAVLVARTTDGLSILVL